MLTVTHTWKCDECGAIKVLDQTELRPKHHILDFHPIPDGWHMIADRLICNRHEITIDGEVRAPVGCWLFCG